MKTRYLVVLPMLLSALSGCSSDGEPTGQRITDPEASSPQHDYITEEEMLALNIADPIATGATSLSWQSSNTLLQTRLSLTMAPQVTKYQGSFSATIKKANGDTVSTESKDFGESDVGGVDIDSKIDFVSTSTNYLTCGLIGNGKSSGSAELSYKVTTPGGGYGIELRTASLASSATPITLPACPKAKLKLAGGGDESETHIEFRGPGNVTLSNHSVVIGSYTCDWWLDGSSVSTDCNGATVAPDTGFHFVKLKVTDANSNVSEVDGDFLIAAPCESSGDGQTSLRANRIALTPTRPRSSAIAPCGNYTTPPGTGGGYPSEPAPGEGVHCHWVREFRFWPDGSWEWTTPWYSSCDGETIRAPILSDAERISPKNTVSSNIRIFGAGKLGSKRNVIIERDSSSAYAVSVTIDTTLATPADLSHALDVAKLLAGRVQPKGLGGYGAIIPDLLSTEGQASSAKYVRAASLLQDLKRGQQIRSRRDGITRFIDFQFDQ